MLQKYADTMAPGSDETVIRDLGYILTKLPEQERQDLVDAVSRLIQQKSEGLGE